MSSTNDVTHMLSLGLESNINTAATDRVFYYHRGLQDVNHNSQILVLIHGYPQSNFMWRHIVPLLPADIPLFIPDIPGYGRSAPLPRTHDKRSTGMAILDALDSVLPSTGILAPLILAGHDRGARICHRLGVDARLHEDRFEIVGTIFLDIVPTLVQWQTFSSPSASTGSFHWPLLANVKVATAMILAQGGDVWTSTCLDRWVGKGETGLVKFKENNAMEIYCKFFKNESVVKATCDDYRAGAEEDVKLQVSDQKSGAKLDVPVLAVYSANYLGKRYDVRKVWEEWMGYGKVEVLGIGERCGHFIAEEAPEKTAEAIAEFYFGHQ